MRDFGISISESLNEILGNSTFSQILDSTKIQNNKKEKK